MKLFFLLYSGPKEQIKPRLSGNFKFPVSVTRVDYDTETPSYGASCVS